MNVESLRTFVSSSSNYHPLTEHLGVCGLCGPLLAAPADRPGAPAPARGRLLGPGRGLELGQQRGRAVGLVAAARHRALLRRRR